MVSPARNAGWRDEPAEERKVRDQASDLGLRERLREPVDRRVPRRAVGDQLGDQRVVPRADLVALLDARVDADAGRQPQPLDPAGLGQERERILRVEAHLDRMAVRRSGLSELAALGDPDLVGDEVAAGHGLGYGVLDLDAGVELQEEEPPAADQELGRAGASVADRAGEPGSRRRRGRSRSSGSVPGDGDSSSTFWWRRWIEHSRSPSASTVPWASASSCTSTCRAPSTQRSQNTVSSPNAASASRPRGLERGLELGARSARPASRGRLPRPRP